MYYGKSHMECYSFCQQCEDPFATTGAKGPNRIPFAVSFLRDRINFRWLQYKRKLDAGSSVPISWDEFETLLRQSLGDSRAFVDSYWAKIKRDSQYQQEDVLDWAAHLEHLQAVLGEFDPVAAPNDDSLIRYFREDLRPSIQAQLDARGRDLDSWDEVVEKAVDAEAKASLQLPSRTREIDFRCPRDERPSKTNDKPSRDSEDSEAKKEDKFSHTPSANLGGGQMSGRQMSGQMSAVTYQVSSQISHQARKIQTFIEALVKAPIDPPKN